MAQINNEPPSEAAIIDFGETSLGKQDGPRVARLKKYAQKLALAGLGLVTTTTGIGLALDAYQTPNRDGSPQKAIPTLVNPLPTPDIYTYSPSSKTVTEAELNETAEKQVPHLIYSDFIKLSKEEQEKIISKTKGVTPVLVLDSADALNLNYSSDDEYGNKVLIDSNSKNDLPVKFVMSSGEYEDLKKKSVNNSDVAFEKGTKLLVLVLLDQHSNEPGLRLAPLQVAPPAKNP